MNRIVWYFKQPLSFNDLDYIDDSTESIQRSSLSESELPFGIVSGFVMQPGSGFALQTTSDPGVAYDQLGRRITPTTSSPLTQSLDATTEGGGTSVSGGGNERWISVFVRYGRKFTDPQTDGNGLTVRKKAEECMNALGDAEHPVGAYESVAAKEAGIDKFYIVAGTEDGLGRAVRPTLITDGVLVCDVHRVNGQTTIAATDIVTDRRQNLIPVLARIAGSEEDHFATFNGPQSGYDQESLLFLSGTTLTFRVDGGRGYVRSPTDTGADPRDYHRYSLAFSGTTIPAVPPHASLPRFDLVVVTSDGEVRVVPGVAAATPVAPTTPVGALALFVVKAMPGTTNTSTWPFARASFKRMPYPFSEMQGILKGCRLKWSWPAYAGLVIGTHVATAVYAEALTNKIVVNGEGVDFQGGTTITVPTFGAQQDTLHNPFSGAATSHKPYYIYACRNQVVSGVGAVLSSVVLLESLSVPDPTTGLSTADLAWSGGSVPAYDALCIGVGWAIANTTQRMPVLQNGNWFTPLINEPNTELFGFSPPSFNPWVPVPVWSTGGTHAISLPGTPDVLTGRVRCRIRYTLQADTVIGLPQNKLYVCYGEGHGGAGGANRRDAFAIITEPPGSIIGQIQELAGEFTFPTEAGKITFESDHAGWEVSAMDFEIRLPRLLEP